MNETQSKIIELCTECVAEWKKENWEEPIDIDYDDYANVCYNHGGGELRALFDDAYSDCGEDEEQKFLDEISYRCEIVNRGIRSAIGCRVRYIRVSNDMSIEELAEKSGVTASNIRNIENGKYDIKIDTLNKIAKAMGVEINIM